MKDFDMSQPLVSVLMCVYSEPLEWIHQSVSSILNQSYSKFEFILVNDAPKRTDLKKTLDNYSTCDDRICLIENSKNFGLTRSLNTGLEKCRGKYIVRMDADDISGLTRVEEQVKFMEQNSEIGVCGTWAKLFGARNGIEKRALKDESLKFSMVLQSPFIHPSVIIRKAVLDTNRIRYNENYRFAQDYGLWSDLMKVTIFANLPLILLNYRLSNQQISNRNQEQKKIAYQIRQDVIRTLYGENIEKIIYGGEKINLNTIKMVKESLMRYDKRDAPLMNALYLSLQHYSFTVFLVYLRNLKYFNLEVAIKIIKRNFIHDSKNRRI
ncbi:glycosyltransferase [Draconibacterium mangrovi]|uniref:glycosyltransferase n=1 Tax=Draconibacterium mangrovi TaxID=2697469 RepID=UPI0013D36EFF|nr:glycosyltransferase [Draconibacterium mangrovi]